MGAPRGPRAEEPNDVRTPPRRGWLDRRVDWQGIRRALLDRPVPERLTWWHTLGSATLTAFLVQVVTGVVLATFFAPAPDHAYDSVRYIETRVPMGAFLRGMHAWGASAMVLLLLAHMVRVFAMGAYKYPREPNWLIGIALFAVTMAFGFTGYLLPWDQKAYWGTQVGTSLAGTAPVVGGFVARVLRGGSMLGAATLARFYALHVLWLPALLGALVGLHLVIVVRQGIAARTAALEAGAPPRTSDPAYPAHYEAAYAATKRSGVRFWPDVVAKDLVASVVVVLAIAALALTRGATLEPPADPTDTSYVPQPEWYFLPFYQFLKLFPGSLESTVAVGVPLLLFLALVALPFFDRRSTRSLRRRPVALASLTVLVGGSSYLLGAALQDLGALRGGRGTELAAAGPPLGAVERAGRAAFRRQCAGCHLVAGEQGDAKGGEEEDEDGPELTEIGLKHSAAWLHSFIEAPIRFHPESAMPAFGPPVLSHQEVEEIARYLVTLRGPPGAPPRQPDIRDTFPQLDTTAAMPASSPAVASARTSGHAPARTP